MTKPLILGSSNAGTWRDCHEKYRLRYVEHLVPKKPDMKTTFGSAFHHAADMYYKTQDMQQSQEEFVKVARTADLPLSMDHETKENPRSIERGINLFEAWVAKYEKEPFKLMRKPDGTPFTELRFTLNIGEYNGIQIAVTGTIDKIVEAGNRIYVLDIKTTRRALSQFQNSMRPNHQLTGYFAGAREFLGEKVFSVGYDAIFISKRKPNTKKGGWFNYGVDFEKDFMRTFTTRSEKDVELWQKNMLDDAVDILRNMEDRPEAPWSMNAPTACWRYGRCDYLDVCNHNRDKIVIDSLYERKEWKPYADSRDDWTEEGDDESNGS